MPIADPEKRREYDRERSKAKYDPERARAYYQANRERILARNKEYQAKLPDGQRKQRREYKTAKQAEYDNRPGVRQANRDKAREWWRALDPERAWGYSLKKVHGMQPEQWHAMFMEQRGLCYLCERRLPDDRAKVAIDHDHSHCGPLRSCGVCRRGLAHHQCNSSIGLLEEDPALLRLIADNLERAKALTAALILSAPQQDQLF